MTKSPNSCISRRIGYPIIVLLALLLLLPVQTMFATDAAEQHATTSQTSDYETYRQTIAEALKLHQITAAQARDYLAAAKAAQPAGPSTPPPGKVLDPNFPWPSGKTGPITVTQVLGLDTGGYTWDITWRYEGDRLYLDLVGATAGAGLGYYGFNASGAYFITQSKIIFRYSKANHSIIAYDRSTATRDQAPPTDLNKTWGTMLK